MHNNEQWQVFHENGTPIPGVGYPPEIFEQDESLSTGNAHVWFWKRDDAGVISIMLQKRAFTKKLRPGWYHISAGGHINLGETPVEAAVRETQEEMGYTIEPDKLFFVHATRNIHYSPRDIKFVFLYQLHGNETFEHTDGEVDSFEWRTLDNFKEISREADKHNLVPQGLLYFDTLIVALEYVAQPD